MVILPVFLAFSGVAGAQCYQLYDSQDRTIYEGLAPPFDISLPGESAASRASRARGECLMITPGSLAASRLIEVRQTLEADKANHPQALAMVAIEARAVMGKSVRAAKAESWAAQRMGAISAMTGLPVPASSVVGEHGLLRAGIIFIDVSLIDPAKITSGLELEWPHQLWAMPIDRF